MNEENGPARDEIAKNLNSVRERIGEACKRAGRDPQKVLLVAVSKMKPADAVALAYGAGARDFGENYVQELREKLGFFSERDEKAGIRWHMIGHLQKNKVKYLIGNVALIHSVDTVELAEQIEKEAAKKGSVMNVLLEVNVAEEESKWGFRTAEVLDAAGKIAALPHVRLLGLMTSAPMTSEPESNRPYFQTLRRLAKMLENNGLIAHSDAFQTPVLSMGMSNDYEVAVEEGATMVRVGTAVFGARTAGPNHGTVVSNQ